MAILTRPLLQSVAQPAIPLIAHILHTPRIPFTSPFDADKQVFVLTRGTVPGIHYGWFVLY